MKTKILIIAACCALAARFAARADDSEPQFVDCGGVMIVTFANGLSRDGRYTIGWTIRPRSKKAKPVDWSLWKSGEGENAKFQDRYAWDEEQTKNPPYELAVFVVDLKQHKAVEFNDTWAPASNPAVSWSREINGRQYGFLRKVRHFGTCDYWLIATDGKEMRAVDILKGLGKAVDQFMDKNAASKAGKDRFAFFSADDNPGNMVSVDGSMAWISFSVENFDNHDDDVTGILTLRLPDGAVADVSDKIDAAGLPFKEDAALAKADGDLNQVYAKLQKQLNPGGREALKKEQREWIERRNSAGADAAGKASAGWADPDIARNKALLDFTLKRAAELKARLRTQ